MIASQDGEIVDNYPDFASHVELAQKIADGTAAFDDYMALGQFYLFNGMFQQVLELFTKARALPLSYIEQAHLHQQEAEALLYLGRTEEAESNLRRSLEVPSPSENSFDYFWIMGRGHYTLFLLAKDPAALAKHSEKAIEYYAHALTLDPPGDNPARRHSFIYSWLGDIHFRTGRFDAAIQAHEQALLLAEGQEDIVSILRDTAMAYGSKGDFGKAEEYFKKAVEQAGQNIPATRIHFEMGKMFVSSGNLSAARNAFNDAQKYLENDLKLRNTPDYQTGILWYLGFIAYAVDEGDEAISRMSKVLERIDERHALYARSCLIIAHMRYKRGEPDQAREYYHRVQQAPFADPEDIEAAKRYLASIPEKTT